MAEVKYQYAYDENSKLVSINDYTKETSKLHTFKCITCGDTLLPRAIGSEHRKAHFYHKSIVQCSGETYLHKLSKLLIKKKFDDSDNFFVSYLVTKKCNNADCNLRNLECSHKEHIKLDLKKYYDTCSEEINYNGYIADLLLTSSKNINLPPVFIEIFVSHACEEDKLNSGLRIIEIPIRNEQDIKNIEASEVLEEPLLIEKKKSDIKFISFKRVIKLPMVSDIYRYILYSDKDEENYFTKIKCKDAGHKLLKNSKIELNMVNLSSHLELGLYHALRWMSENKFIRRCNLCKFYYSTLYENNAICRLSKKYGTPKYPNMKDAESCRSYSLNDRMVLGANYDELYIEEICSTVGAKNSYRVIIAGSSSFYGYELLKDRCDFFLSSKMRDHIVIVLAGTSWKTTDLISRYAEERSILVEYYEANWERDGKDAGFKTNERMLEKADALIAFWDGKGTITNSLIKQAKIKGIRVAVVDYQR